MTIKGLDIFHGDKPLQFHAMVEAGVKYIFIKATQGLHTIDPCYEDNYHRAKSVGLLVGSYHFFDENEDGKAQADHFLNVAHLNPGDIIPALDAEVYAPGMPLRSKAFAQEIKTRIGRWPILYSGDAFYQEHLKDVFPEGLHTLWIARYSAHKPKTRCAFWQYTDAARIPGDPPLDSEQFFGAMVDLKQHLIY
jgi:lysozyme